ncbi:MAG TPA: MBL fold metallo-hydrolase [Vitreimonas sp.]|uniref:ComEC/Rec2 family competence protein n=1 Tax=Vitreimonas sp. TaxID=3069702 RepID=UPI002D60B3FF|nr:MBL fold metallo-hydrolase [Vitreimonas sp.]HYD86016.1 MBL fold metallo-hydrolase [Vitreimonas sp.]
MKRIATTAARTLVALALAGCAGAGAPARSTSPQANAIGAVEQTSVDVWMLDIGQGSCVVVDCPGRLIVFDCGSSGGSSNELTRNNTEAATAWVRERARAAGALTVLVSHADADHYNLIAEAAPAELTDRVLLADPLHMHGAAFVEWTSNLRGGEDAVLEFTANAFSPADSDLQCGNARADALIANLAGSAQTNPHSAVVALSFGDTSVVLPGDAHGATERAAIAAMSSLPHLSSNQTVLIGSHHGAGTEGSNSQEWIGAWRLQGAIFSMRPTSYQHPTCEVVRRFDAAMNQRLAPHEVTCDGEEAHQTRDRILTTHDNGHMLVRLRGDRLSIYCQRRTPGCAGRLPAAARLPGRTAPTA